MNFDNIKLIEPTVELKSEFLTMAEEFKAAGEDKINGVGCIDADNFENTVRLSKDHVDGKNLPQGWVPSSTYWVVCDGIIIGTCHIRHKLNDFLKNYGGHIGYSIRPSQQGNGCGTQMLALALKKAKALGLDRVLITCDDNNIASARVIEKNDGKLADKVPTGPKEALTRRYWIELNRSDTK